MDKKILMKVLPKGILAGIGLALLYVIVRLLLNGGTFFGHLFSVYGILTMVCIPIAWVANFYGKEQAKAKA